MEKENASRSVPCGSDNKDCNKIALNCLDEWLCKERSMEKVALKELAGGNIVKQPPPVINLSPRSTKRHSCRTPFPSTGL